MIAAKFFEDCFYKNDYYARVGGLATEELNLLEVEFLCAIHFSLLVPPEDYCIYHNEIIRHVMTGACQQCRPLVLPSLGWSNSSQTMLSYEPIKQMTPFSPCTAASPCDLDS